MSRHSQQISATEELWEADGQLWARSDVRAREPARSVPVDGDRWPAGVSPVSWGQMLSLISCRGFLHIMSNQPALRTGNIWHSDSQVVHKNETVFIGPSPQTAGSWSRRTLGLGRCCSPPTSIQTIWVTSSQATSRLPQFPIVWANGP